MADDYTVALRITVSKGSPETLVVMEESTFPSVSFAQMTHLSSEFYELIAKLQKEKK
jgi:hypothetical protein